MDGTLQACEPLWGKNTSKDRPLLHQGLHPIGGKYQVGGGANVAPPVGVGVLYEGQTTPIVVGGGDLQGSSGHSPLGPGDGDHPERLLVWKDTGYVRL